jgi:Ni,Fe-hydrogenase III large subunit/Ni,Fe-hydrogenase III component G
MVDVITASPKDMRDVVIECYKRSRHGLHAMFANDERQISNNYVIYCLFDAADGPGFLLIKVPLSADEPLEYPSLTPYLPSAAWYEREINDLFGIVPIGHPDLRPLVLHENWPVGVYPLRKDFCLDSELVNDGTSFPMGHAHGAGVFEVPVGPIHAGIIEPGHFRFSQAGEMIIKLDARLFFTHRGIEKSLEGLAPGEALYRVERICGTCSVSNALNFAQAIETAASITAPERAMIIRIIVAELERLYNHISDTGNLCAGVGFSVGTSNGSRIKEQLMRLNEFVTGNRFLRGMIVPGGVAFDLPVEYQEEISRTLYTVEADFHDLVALLKESDAFLDRVNTTGILTHNAARDLGVVGIAARASGIDQDLRRDKPYSGYNNIGFRVPVYQTGDVAARLWVRVDEVAESIRIIRQSLKKLADCKADIAVSVPDISPYATGLGWSESARGGNIHWVMFDDDNRIYRYFVRSASYPNWPALTVATPGNIIPDFPLINKSFELCYACLDR